MKYMILMFGDQSGMATQTPEWIKEMMQFMHRFNADMMQSAEFVDAQGLADASQAKTVRFKDGTPVATDGPYAESKESLAGYWIVDVENEARAIELASRVVAFIGPAGAPPIEIRQIGSAPPEM
jgi:hypothetical protein